MTFARQLRENSTDAERRLWSLLRNRNFHNLKFRRQQPMGAYIIDFICFEAKLVIEADGSQHSEQTEYDQRRTEWLESQGFRVLRFWNNDVLGNPEGVAEAIDEVLRELSSGSPPHPNPLPRGERE